MKSVFAVCAAAFYGLSLRIMFGFLDNFMGIMSITFIGLVPVIIGFLTIILQSKESTTNTSSAFFKPWITCLLLLIFTMVLNVEGAICWIMIYPFFAFLAGIGGVLAYMIRQANSVNSGNQDWKEPNTLNISLMIVLPFVVGLAEGERTLSRQEYTLSESVVIPASSKEVWYHLTHINEITDKENTSSVANIIGFPRHIRTTLDTVSIGAKRTAVYENGLYFDETITAFEPEKLLVLDIATDPAKIPPTVMDEHIVIGGKHIDILQDVYTLEQLSDNSCRLTLSSRYFINTPFNWYSGIWATYVMSDILQGEVKVIKERSAHKM